MRLLHEGPDIQVLLGEIRAQHGANARIVKAERIRTGGIAGFFAKQHFEVTLEVAEGDDARRSVPAQRSVSPGLAASDPVSGSGNQTTGGAASSLEALVAAAEREDVAHLPAASLAANSADPFRTSDVIYEALNANTADAFSTVLEKVSKWEQEAHVQSDLDGPGADVGSAGDSLRVVTERPETSTAESAPTTAGPTETSRTPDASRRAASTVADDREAFFALFSDDTLSEWGLGNDVVADIQPTLTPPVINEPATTPAPVPAAVEPVQQVPVQPVPAPPVPAQAVPAAEPVASPAPAPETVAAEAVPQPQTPPSEVPSQQLADPVARPIDEPMIAAAESPRTPGTSEPRPWNPPVLGDDELAYALVVRHSHPEPAPAPEPAPRQVSTRAALAAYAQAAASQPAASQPAPQRPAAPAARESVVPSDTPQARPDEPQSQSDKPQTRRERRQMMAQRTEESQVLKRLAELGLPSSILAQLPSEPTTADLTAVLGQLPRASSSRPDEGEVIAILVEPGEADSAGSRIARRWRMDPANVAGRSGATRLSGEKQAARLANQARRSGEPQLLVLDAELNGFDAEWAFDVLNAAKPDRVLAVVDATRKPNDIDSWLTTITGMIDAVLLVNTSSTATPAAVLQLGIPVSEIDGRPGTAAEWASLLMARVFEGER